MINTYLFDLDGTLIDYSVYKKIYNDIINFLKRELNLSNEELNKLALKKGIKRNPDGNFDSGYLCQELNLLDPYYEILEKELKNKKYLRFDINKLFLDLKQKGIQIGICSNSMGRTIKLHLDGNKINNYDFIFSSEDANSKKNKKEYWLELIKEHNLKPKECLVIGDDEMDDGIMPASLGFNTKSII